MHLLHQKKQNFRRWIHSILSWNPEKHIRESRFLKWHNSMKRQKFSGRIKIQNKTTENLKWKVNNLKADRSFSSQLVWKYRKANYMISGAGVKRANTLHSLGFDGPKKERKMQREEKGARPIIDRTFRSWCTSLSVIELEQKWSVRDRQLGLEDEKS